MGNGDAEMMHGPTDITIEVFNHCLGTCTGCMLSVVERKVIAPVMQPLAFSKAMKAIADYGQRTGMHYRPVLVYGDIPWMPVDIQKRYYKATTDVGLPIGLTMTLVEDQRIDNYRRGIDAALETGKDLVFDITVDPIRLFRDDGYRERILMGASAAPELHLQMLLSEAVLTRNTPEDLAVKISDALEHRPISLGFTPALSRMQGVNFKYEVGSAALWAKRFYQATPEGKVLLAAELDRYSVGRHYEDFLTQTFHVGPNMTIWPTGYTLFGDVIMDERNGGKPMGRIGDEDLYDILHGRVAKRMAVLGEAGMSEGDFDCHNCKHVSSCSFHGIGAVRRVYRGHETRTGSCHGPITFMEVA
jgi:hypothetical protein